MQRLHLIFFIFFFDISLRASFKKDTESEWVTLMETTKDGVIIVSDPESAGELPTIEASYYQKSKIKIYSVVKTKEYTISKLIRKTNLTELILEDYPDKHLTKRTVCKDRVLLKVAACSSK